MTFVLMNYCEVESSQILIKSSFNDWWQRKWTLIITPTKPINSFSPIQILWPHVEIVASSMAMAWIFITKCNKLVWTSLSLYSDISLSYLKSHWLLTVRYILYILRYFCKIITLSISNRWNVYICITACFTLHRLSIKCHKKLNFRMCLLECKSS